jgi:hypothetical protein
MGGIQADTPSALPRHSSERWNPFASCPYVGSKDQDGFQRSLE